MKTKKRSLIALTITFVVCMLLALTTMFVGSGSTKANAGFSQLRFGDGSGFNTYYLNHWKNGQGSAGAEDDGGAWYFGYGDVTTSGYSFTQATKSSTTGAENDPTYTTSDSGGNTSHQMSYGYDVSTRAYATANTQTMYVWEATEAGKVQFSGIVGKATGDKEVAVGNAMGLSGKAWLPFDWGSVGQFDWISGQSYTVSIFRVNASGTIEQIDSQTYTDSYFYVLSDTVYSVKKGDKIVFGLKCNATGAVDEWSTNHIMILASDYEKWLQPAYSFNNNMILQRGKPVNVYGFSADPSRTVSVTFNGQTKTGTPQSNGDWSVTLDSMEANSVGQDMVITDGVNTITYTNVKVGEVWLASGQSNMEYTLGALLENRGYTDVYAGGVDYASSPISEYATYTNYDQISIYSQYYQIATSPDKYGVPNRWLENGWAVPGSLTGALGYSAYAVGFALRLQQDLGIPVGIMVCACGGSSIEEWLAAETITNNSLTLHYGTSKPASRLYNGMMYTLEQHTVGGFLWYQGCADSGQGSDATAETWVGHWKNDMIAFAAQLRSAHGDIPFISQSLVEYGDWSPWAWIREANRDLMYSGLIKDFYAVNGIGNGNPYETMATGNQIHPADKYGISRNAADIAATNVYSKAGFNDVAEYPVAVYKSGSDVVIEYDSSITLKLSEGTTVNNLRAYDGSGSWYTVTNATVSGNKVIIPSSSATVIEYAKYNIMGTNVVTGTAGYDNETYYSSSKVNLYSSKAGCPDLAVFPIFVYNVAAEPTTYSVSVTNDSSKGTVAGVTDGTTVVHDSNLSISVEAKEGYTISSITLNGSPVTVTNDKLMTFSHYVSSAVTLIVTYAEEVAPPTTYQATITNDSSKGTVTGIANGTSYEENSSLTILVTALTGYNIESITLNGSPVTVTNVDTMSITHTVTGAITLAVTYVQEVVAPTTYTATVTNDSSKGTVTGIVNGQGYAEGDLLSISVTPSTGYDIASVTLNGVAQTVSNVNSFTVSHTVAGAITLSVTYSQEVVDTTTYTATVTNDSSKGTVTGIVNGQSYAQGASITISVTANTGYDIASINLNGSPVSVTNVNTMSIPHTVTGAITLNVTYQKESYSASITNDTSKGAVIGIQNGTSYEHGTQLTIVITANTGYDIASVMLNGSSQTITNKDALNIPHTVTGAITLVVTYEQEAVSPTKYTASVTINDSVNGSVIGVSDGEEFDSGSSIVVGVTANAGYEITSVKVNGVAKTISNKTAFSFNVTIEGNVSIEVEISKQIKYYALTIANINTQGTVTGVTNNSTHAENTLLEITVTAKSGYKIKSIKFGDKNITVANNGTTVTFKEKITANTTLAVAYEKLPTSTDNTGSNGNGGTASGTTGDTTGGTTGNTNTDATTDTTDSKGCGSSMVVSYVGIFALIVAGVCLMVKRTKKDNE